MARRSYRSNIPGLKLPFDLPNQKQGINGLVIELELHQIIYNMWIRSERNKTDHS
jgi:hypothetical protein